MENSKIEWCDNTFNPWEGCTKVSPGCAHCYAETRNARWNGGTAPNWGKGAPRRRTSEANWRKPIQWNASGLAQCVSCSHRFAAAIGGEEIFCPSCGDPEANAARPRVFCASLADWLDDEVPIEWLADLLDLIRTTPNLDWLLLTKRPENWKSRIQAVKDYICPENDIATEAYDFVWLWNLGDVPPNVWIGTSVEDQTRADQRIPELLEIPAKVRFLSCEPLLEPVNVMNALINHKFAWCEGVGLSHASMSARINSMPWIDWVIAGGESGKDARPMQTEWAQSLRDQCQQGGVKFFMKQMGGTRDKRDRLEDMPEDLRIRQFPA